MKQFLLFLLGLMQGIESKLDQLRETLLSRVEVDADTGCWLWTGADNGVGYGRIKFLGRCWSAHRLMYRLYVGPIPKGYDVCHRCDTRSCVRPDHLYAGSRSDNMRDAADRGSLNSVILTPADVRAIRAQRKFPTGRLAQQYGVSLTAIRDVKHGRTWQHVD